MSTRDEYEAQKVLNCSTLNWQAHITGAFCEPAIQLSYSLEQGFKMAGKIISKILHYISVISPPVDYQASSRLIQWVVTWKESDILPLCFVSAPRASMFSGTFMAVKSRRHYGLSWISRQFLFSIQNVPSIWKYITLLNVIQDLVNKVNRQHLLFVPWSPS